LWFCMIMQQKRIKLIFGANINFRTEIVHTQNTEY